MFQEQVVKPAAFAEIIDGNDVLVVQSGKQFTFLGKAFGEPRLGFEVSGENFQSNEAVEFRLSGFENTTHSAATNGFNDFQLRKGCPERVDVRHYILCPFSARLIELPIVGCVNGIVQSDSKLRGRTGYELEQADWTGFAVLERTTTFGAGLFRHGAVVWQKERSLL